MTLLATRAFRRLSDLSRSERGGAMVELAVILPVLILFAIGVMDYGRVFFRSLMVANAARAGAEWGALDPAHYLNSSGIQSFAKLDGQEITSLKVSSELICKCGDAVLDCSLSCPNYGPPCVYVKVTAIDTVVMFLKYPGLSDKIAVKDTAIFRAQ